MKNNLAWRYVKATPRRSILTIFGIAMALAMMMCIGNAISTILESSRQSLYERYGTWDVMFALEGSDVSESGISGQDKVKKTAAIYERASVFFPQLRDETTSDQEWLRYFGIRYISADESVTSMMHLEIADGRYPADDAEAIISRSLANELGVEIGDKIEMDAGKTVEGDFYMDENGNEWPELSFEGTARSHVVVGIADDSAEENQGLFTSGDLVVTGRNAEQPSIVLANFINGTNEVVRAEEIATSLGLNGANMEMNMAVYTTSFSSMMAEMFMVGVIFLFCCSLVAFAAISIVRNSFSMSVTERMRDYGLLRCAGATQQQIKRLIRNEVLIMLIVAFPLSMLISYVASAGVLSIVNGMELIGIPHLYLTVSWFFVVLSLGVALLSVIIAVVGPSKKASNISPILITTGQGDAETIQAKAVAKKSKLGRLFGMEWELASRNRRAAGKRSRTTVFSMTVSVALLLATAGMMQTYLLPSMQEAESEIDISVQSIDYERDDERMSIEEFNEYCDNAAKLEGVLSSARMQQVYLYSAFISDRWVNNSDFIAEAYGGIEDDIYMQFKINFIGRSEYQQLQTANGELAGLDYDAWVNSGEAILNDYVKASLYNDFGREIKSSRQNLFMLNEGDRLELTVEEYMQEDYIEDSYESDMPPGEEDVKSSGWSVAIGKKVRNRVWFDDTSNADSTPIIYLPEDAAAEHMPILSKANGYSNKLLLLQTDPALNKQVEDALYTGDPINVINLYQEEVMLRNVILLISICVYSFVGVIALISCLNIVNIIGTNLVLRRRDFGLLQAVGMNVKQMRKMIVFECVQFSLRSMVYGSILGFSALVGLHFVMTRQATTDFYINPLTVLAIFVGCFLVSIIASWPTWKKMKKISIMDSIRHIG